MTDGTVRLRPPTEADLPELADAIRASAAELAEYLPWAIGEYDERDTRDWIRRRGYPNEVGFVILDPTGTIVGVCGLNGFDELHRSANLGFWLRTSAHGNGYATRAGRLVAAHGFDAYRLRRIEIMMAVANTASRRVAERLGARHEGILRSKLQLGGHRHDAHLYSLLPGETA
ncbi:MAG TPA: GNAT family protein [Ilumatobacter sp.]